MGGVSGALGLKGLGLIGMQERVDGLGGTLRILSGPGKGTAVEASLPLPQPFAASANTLAEIEDRDRAEIRTASS